MSSKRTGLLSLVTLAAILITACQAAPGGAPAATTAPASTAEVINPPVIKETTAATTEATQATESTATTEATAAQAATKAATTAPTTSAGAGAFTVNGVTMPFNRNEAIIMDQVNYAVFDSFNPFIPNGLEFAAGWWQISTEYLWYVNYATGEIIPWLATGHEYNADYTELTVKINPEAKWNDGTAFTANDIAYTYEMRKKDPAALGNPDPDNIIESVTAKDDLTAVYKFKSPQPRYHLQFWCRICTGAVFIPKHIWEKQDPKTFKNNPPVTTGPYMLDKTYPDQKVFVWKKNPNYWNKAKFDPAPNYVVYRSGPASSDQIVADMAANNTDVLGLQYDIFQEQATKLSQYSGIAYVDPCPRGAFFNNAKAPFDKPEVRRALSMMMNREKWGENIWAPPSKPAKGLWADYRNMDQYINPESAGKWKTLTYDPAEALKLLESVGFKKDGNTLLGPDGQPFKFVVGTPTRPTDFEYLIAQDWIEDLKAQGIEASLQNFEQPVWFNRVDTGDWEVGVWWFCGATVDPMELYQSYTCDRVVPIGERQTTGNNVRACNKEFDEIVGKLQKITPDAPEAGALYQQAFDKWMEQAFGVPLIETYYPAQFNTTYWDGLPTKENLYTVPFNWWGQIMWVLFNAKPKA
jgi:peptide/nickel transport system substrate-binding protein